MIHNLDGSLLLADKPEQIFFRFRPEATEVQRELLLQGGFLALYQSRPTFSGVDSDLDFFRDHYTANVPFPMVSMVLDYLNLPDSQKFLAGRVSPPPGIDRGRELEPIGYGMMR